MSAHALLKMARDLFRAMSLALRQKYPRNVVEMKEAMAAFFGSDSVAISCHCKRSKNILVKVLSGMFSLENVAPWKRRTNPVVVICRRYWLCNRRHGCERHAKKVGNFDFLCLLLVSCTSVQQEIVRK